MMAMTDEEKIAAKRASSAKYRAENPEKVRARCAKWNAENPGKGRAYYNKYRAENPERARAHSLVGKARARARAKGRECLVSVPDITERIVAGRCEATGIAFEIVSNNGEQHPLSPSLDRIDSSKGYTPDNVQVVIWAYNAMKNQWDDDMILQVADARRAHLQRQNCA